MEENVDLDLDLVKEEEQFKASNKNRNSLGLSQALWTSLTWLASSSARHHFNEQSDQNAEEDAEGGEEEEEEEEVISELDFQETIRKVTSVDFSENYKDSYSAWLAMNVYFDHEDDIPQKVKPKRRATLKKKYELSLPPGWTRVSTCNAREFRAALYYSETASTYVISIRGTKNARNWLFNVTGLGKQKIASTLSWLTDIKEESFKSYLSDSLHQKGLEMLRAYVLDALELSKGKTLRLTGHSLGGALAQAFSASFSIPGVSFNAPAIGSFSFSGDNFDEIIARRQGLIMKDPYFFVNHRIDGDAVSAINASEGHFGPVITHYTDIWSSSSSLSLPRRVKVVHGILYAAKQLHYDGCLHEKNLCEVFKDGDTAFLCKVCCRGASRKLLRDTLEVTSIAVIGSLMATSLRYAGSVIQKRMNSSPPSSLALSNASDTSSPP